MGNVTHVIQIFTCNWVDFGACRTVHPALLSEKTSVSRALRTAIPAPHSMSAFTALLASSYIKESAFPTAQMDCMATMLSGIAYYARIAAAHA
jgi:hypothetical protein